MSLENSIIYPVLFKQVRILSADSSSNIAEPFADVFVDSDHQIHLNFDQSQIPQETNIDQRSGVVLGTGLIDLYSTSSEPGHESKETISELVQAAK
ncbi:MAG: dihydroorotase, partial [Pseudanabaena sp.]